ncbi:GH3 auxin-responsive promoter family protein [Chloroflexota bacterium]
MVYVAVGCLGFLIVHTFDIVSIKRWPVAKPLVWAIGCGLTAYAGVMLYLSPSKLIIPMWLVGIGWGLLAISLFLLLYSLFINLPFRKTYFTTGVGDELIKTGMYTLTRHPGVICFTLLMVSLILVSRSSLMLVAATVFILMDITLVILQDRVFFIRMFPGYVEYRRETPMLVPNRQSINAFIHSLKQKGINSLKLKEDIKMATIGELLKQGRHEEMWQRCCGFLDLSIDEFMKIQERLLLEQIALMKKSELGRFIMNGSDPYTVQEFRDQVPLTTYADYAPYLLKRNSKVLPKKPLMWAHTSGRSGEYTFKWVPISSRQYEEMKPVSFAMLILGSCSSKGEITLREHDKALYALPPAPYVSGITGHIIDDEDVIDLIPPIDDTEKIEFAERIQRGFKLAIFDGLDLFGGLSSVLVSVGDRFSQGGGSISLKPFICRPKALLRLVKGKVKSKIARRKMLPRDIWRLKGLMAGGTDTPVFKERIKEMWGRYPLDVYGSTEAPTMAMQTWDYKGMTFLPNLHFFEFIPEEESIRSREDPACKPKTLLMNEVKAGKNYELVITNFHGGAMLRYRVNDMIRITSLRNEELGIDIPQMAFVARIDDIIDIAGFARLTEKVMWQAIENTEIPYSDWTVRKEVGDRPALHLYLELKENGHLTTDHIEASVHNELRKLDNDYADLEVYANLKPLKVTLLPDGAFQTYMLKQQAAGADLAHLKIPHINPSDSMLEFLLSPDRVELATSAEERVAEVSSSR